jgi:large subunit ribosomal protein L15
MTSNHPRVPTGSDEESGGVQAAAGVALPVRGTTDIHRAAEAAQNPILKTPLTRRLPKRGFHNPFKVEFQTINLKDLNEFDAGGKEITAEVLYAAGLIHDMARPVKVLGSGEVTKPLVVKADSFSKSAREKIEKAKGKAEVKARV